MTSLGSQWSDYGVLDDCSRIYSFFKKVNLIFDELECWRRRVEDDMVVRAMFTPQT